jgi:ribokinase
MITVFGSINTDLVTRVAAIPRPGETVHGTDYALIPGGKGANQALAARRAGAGVRMVGAVGDDEMGRVALRELQAAGVDLSAVTQRKGTTGVAIIAVDKAGENVIILSPGANASVNSGQLDALPFKSGDTLLLQMEVPLAESRAAAAKGRKAGARVILSLAPFVPVAESDLTAVDMLIVNEHEAAALALHFGLPEASGAKGVVTALAKRLGKTVIATLGRNGAVASSGKTAIAVPAIPVTPVDTTGAGDTFCGVLAALLDEGADLEAAMRYAAAAGSLACLKEGAQPCFPDRDEIDAAVKSGRTG